MGCSALLCSSRRATKSGIGMYALQTTARVPVDNFNLAVLHS